MVAIWHRRNGCNVEGRSTKPALSDSSGQPRKVVGHVVIGHVSVGHVVIGHVGVGHVVVGHVGGRVRPRRAGSEAGERAKP